MKRKILLLALVLLLGWIAADLLIPRSNSLRQFDPAAVGRLDAEMWRSYYEKKKGKLFWQMSKLCREQFHAPFWRSFPMAWRAAKAAFVFKDGRSREQYAEALPPLEKYFSDISDLSDEPFDVKNAARQELEWWIIRREPQQFSTADWERVLADVASVMYREPVEKFAAYARLRVEAMVLRDAKGKDITEADWLKINDLCVKSWSALHEAVSG